MQQPHIGYVIDVNFCLENNDERFAIKLDGEDGRRKKEFANHGLTLERRYSENRCPGTRIRTFVLTICSFLGLDCGWSAAPTSAIRDVQNNISTIPLAPSSASSHFESSK